MADVQKPGTGNLSPENQHGDGRSPMSPAAGAESGGGDPGIRPFTTKSGLHVISGPLPEAGTSGGGGNTAGTPGFGFTFHGSAGGAFLINGAGFNQYGDVYVGGKQVTVTAWDQNRIKGLLPKDVDVNAEVMVVDGTGTVQRGPATVQGGSGQVQLTHEVSREEFENLRRGGTIKVEGDKPKGAAPAGSTEAAVKSGDAGAPGKK